MLYIYTIYIHIVIYVHYILYLYGVYTVICILYSVLYSILSFSFSLCIYIYVLHIVYIVYSYMEPVRKPLAGRFQHADSLQEPCGSCARDFGVLWMNLRSVVPIAI